MNVLLKILPRYTKHASEHRASSLLPQYYGLYTIEVGRRSKAHFIIMNYWFATMHEIGTRYDLKGSTKGRRASAKEKKKGPSAIYKGAFYTLVPIRPRSRGERRSLRTLPGASLRPGSLAFNPDTPRRLSTPPDAFELHPDIARMEWPKDLDFLARNQCVETPLAEDVKVAIAKDVEFMRANKLIDYSMMLGLHTRRREGEETVAEGDSPGRGPGYGLKPGPGPRASVSDDDAAATTAPGAPPSSPEGGDAPDDQSITPPGPNTAARLETYRRRVDGKVGPFSASVEEDETAMFQLRALETPDGLAYLGIIDILTQYGGAKAIENFCCGVVAGCGADISCQPPRKYARRFLRLINKMLKPPEKDGAKWEERGDGAVRKLEWR
jgi:1-phosphatidylinositol-4-phosphate 5-kinase